MKRILVLLLCLMTVVSLFASCDTRRRNSYSGDETETVEEKKKKNDSEEGNDTEKSDTGETLSKKDVAGDWAVDVKSLSRDKLIEMMSLSLGTEDKKMAAQLFEKLPLEKMMDPSLSAMHFRFSENGKYQIVILWKEYRDGLLDMYDTLYDQLGKMSVREIASIYGKTEEELQQSLDEAGETLAERFARLKEFYRTMGEKMYTEEYFMKRFSGGEVNSRGEIVHKDAYAYTIRGNRLTIEDRGGTSVFVYRDGQLVLEEAMPETDDAKRKQRIQLVIGMELKKADD